MFMVTEADATAIQEAYDRAGELAAVVELKQRFRGITDNEAARRVRAQYRGMAGAC